MRRFVAVCALAGATLLTPGAAGAEPSINAAQQLCASQKGDFEEGIVGGAIYTCFNHQDGGYSFSPTQIATATRVCENVYGGTLVEFARHYKCNP